MVVTVFDGRHDRLRAACGVPGPLPPSGSTYYTPGKEILPDDRDRMHR
jgi:hypothetical protein